MVAYLMSYKVKPVGTPEIYNIIQQERNSELVQDQFKYKHILRVLVHKKTPVVILKLQD